MSRTDRVAPRETPRQATRRHLGSGACTARELSALVGLREKDVVEHLEHLARTLRAGGERLEVEPTRCLGCGYVFRERARLTKPSACPRCRGQHLTAPVFSISERGGQRP